MNAYTALHGVAGNTALALLTSALLLTILWDDWRVSLLGWGGAAVAAGLLLLPLWPAPWAISRTISMALEGTLLWLGARRWALPKHHIVPYGLSVRIPLLFILSLTMWQLHIYYPFPSAPLPAMWAMSTFLIAGFVLLTTGGDAFHTTLGLLALLNAAVFALAPLPIPTDWLWSLTVLDLLIGVTGGMVVASGGIYLQIVRSRWEKER